MKNLLQNDGQLYLYKAFYNSQQAEQLLVTLLNDISWQQEQIFIYGRRLKVPRKMCWYGDEGANYKYSGAEHKPLPWTLPLTLIKQRIEKDFNCTFNSVMANLYRKGSDSMGCHADDEKELGRNPFIASLSLGDERVLKFKHKNSKQNLKVTLCKGDLLIMAGEIQHHWRHELPKTKKNKTERINLTFRKIVSLGGCPRIETVAREI